MKSVFATLKPVSALTLAALIMMSASLLTFAQNSTADSSGNEAVDPRAPRNLGIQPTYPPGQGPAAKKASGKSGGSSNVNAGPQVAPQDPIQPLSPISPRDPIQPRS